MNPKRLIRVLLGVFIVSGIFSGKANEFFGSVYDVPEGSVHFLVREIEPIFNKAINDHNRFLISPYLASYIKIARSNSTSLNGLWDRNNGLNGGKVWVFGQKSNRTEHNQSGFYFHNPSGCFSLISGDTGYESGGSINVASNAIGDNASGGLRFNFDHKPRSFACYEGVGTNFGGIGASLGRTGGNRRSQSLLLHDARLTIDSRYAISRRFSSLGSFFGLEPDRPQSECAYDYERESQTNVEFVPPILTRQSIDDYVALFVLGCYIAIIPFGAYGMFCILDGRRYGYALVGVAFIGAITGAASGIFDCLPWNWRQCLQKECKQQGRSYSQFHSGDTVTQKLLTLPYYCNTLIAIGRAHMANVLSIDKQVAIISGLAEGSGIRQIERITGVHRDTIMRLGVRVGQGCADLLDDKMRNLICQHLQFDEVWGFIGKKQKHVEPTDNPDCGDVWTFCAIDSDTKLVPSFKVGKRDAATANAFVGDVALRLKNRVQVSTDSLNAYVQAVEQAFGANVDYAQIVKVFDDQSMDAEVIGMKKTAFTGRPNMTLAEAAVALHFAYYNFVKRHNTLRCTPAMAAGVERDFWTVGNLIEAAA